ncbi:hypothetical protein [Capnocytophaga catalasegens]|uniref:hypothetical protein n=1 Tax=Capnocytophaga catalasegens TaxID=1004260 RepID=UPI0022308034|nr:hypothetical protein [Capnocytophaga catalasegens]
MKITIPTKWKELTAWQKKEIAFLLLSDKINDSHLVIKLLKILIMQKKHFGQKYVGIECYIKYLFRY